MCSVGAVGAKEILSQDLKLNSSRSAELKVSHPKEDNLMGRGLTLRLDGEKLASLKPGQALTLDIQAGPHKLLVNNTYHSKTVEFDAQPGEQVHFEVNNRAGCFGWFMLTVLGGGPMYLLIDRVDSAESKSLPPPRSDA
jgi:hypothetical protein